MTQYDNHLVPFVSIYELRIVLYYLLCNWTCSVVKEILRDIWLFHVAVPIFDTIGLKGKSLPSLDESCES